MQDQLIFETFNLGTIAELIRHYQGDAAMVTASEDDLTNHLIHFKTELTAYRDPKVDETMKEVDTRCKELESPDFEDVQIKFILELFGESEDFEFDGFSDEGKDDKKDQSDSSDHDD